MIIETMSNTAVHINLSLKYLSIKQVLYKWPNQINHIIFVLYSVMKMHLETNQNTNTIQIIL